MTECEYEYRKSRIALACIQTVLLGIGLGLYIYDRNKPVTVVNGGINLKK